MKKGYRKGHEGRKEAQPSCAFPFALFVPFAV